MKRKNINRKAAVAMAAAVTVFAGKSLAEEKAQPAAGAQQQPEKKRTLNFEAGASASTDSKPAVRTTSETTMISAEEMENKPEINEDAVWVREPEKRFGLGAVHPLGGEHGKRTMYATGTQPYTLVWSNESVKVAEEGISGRYVDKKSEYAFNVLRSAKAHKYKPGLLSAGLDLNHATLETHGEVEDGSGARVPTKGIGDLWTATPSLTFVMNLGGPTELEIFAQAGMEMFDLSRTFRYPSRENIELNEGNNLNAFFNGAGLEFRSLSYIGTDPSFKISRIGAAQLGATRAGDAVNVLGYLTVRARAVNKEKTQAGVEFTPFYMHLAQEHQGGLEIAVPVAAVYGGRFGITPAVRAAFGGESFTMEERISLTAAPVNNVTLSAEVGRFDRFAYGSFTEEMPHTFTSGFRLTLRN